MALRKHCRPRPPPHPTPFQLPHQHTVQLCAQCPPFPTSPHATPTLPRCSAGILCSFAHGAQELRREAAIAGGALPYRYKYDLCPAFDQGG